MAARKNPIGGGKGQDKIWSDAVRRAVMRRDAGGIHAIEKLADAAVQKGLTGDISALREIGDRLEGRAVQPIQADIQGDVTVRWKSGR